MKLRKQFLIKHSIKNKKLNMKIYNSNSQFFSINKYKKLKKSY